MTDEDQYDCFDPCAPPPPPGTMSNRAPRMDIGESLQRLWMARERMREMAVNPPKWYKGP
jgi:hypothetical protein